jgi:hypothetical protein
MKRIFTFAVISLFAMVTFAFAQERRLTIDELLKVRRVGDPQISPKEIWWPSPLPMDQAANKKHDANLSGASGRWRNATTDE